MTDKELEKLFEQKLKPAQPQPFNAANWQAMEGILDAAKPAVYTSYWRTVAVVLGFALVATLALVWQSALSNFNDSQPQSKPVASETPLPENNSVTFNEEDFEEKKTKNANGAIDANPNNEAIADSPLKVKGSAKQALLNQLGSQADDTPTKATSAKVKAPKVVASPISKSKAPINLAAADETADETQPTNKMQPLGNEKPIDSPASNNKGNNSTLPQTISDAVAAPPAKSAERPIENSEAAPESSIAGNTVNPAAGNSANIKPNALRAKVGHQFLAVGGVGANTSYVASQTAGFHAGLGYRMVLNKNWAITTEVIYNRTGDMGLLMQADSIFYGFGRTEVNTEMHYKNVASVRVPLGVEYAVNPKHRLSFGAYADAPQTVSLDLTRTTQSYKGAREVDEQSNTQNRAEFNQINYGLQAGYFYQINNRFGVGLRLNYGLTDLTNDGYKNFEHHHRLLQSDLTLRYRLF